MRFTKENMQIIKTIMTFKHVPTKEAAATTRKL
jgi:hypothetical protein